MASRTTSQPYVFAALADPSRQFRVLSVLPASSKTAPLRAELTVHSLIAGDVYYEALSYRWQDVAGHAGVNPPLVLIGDDKYLFISATVQEALTLLRYPNRPRLLWIDQLCIDQRNSDEKG